MNDRIDKDPSLLEPQSRGGDTAEGGFAFQEGVVLYYVPRWLSREGFSAMTRESIGDTEAMFFVPGRGVTRELLEAKNHALKPGEFWGEIDRFRGLDAGSPNTYALFTLVCTGLSQGLRPLANGLKRVRDPYSFYEGTAIAENSYDAFERLVRGAGRGEEEARFLFERVAIRENLGTEQSGWRGLFQTELTSHFPEYEALSDRTLKDVYEGFNEFLKTRKNRPFVRRELELKLRERIPPLALPPLEPVHLHTSFDRTKEVPPAALVLDWAEFFGGASRDFPAPEAWDERLVGGLEQTKQWVRENRLTKRVRLTGNRRLSASLAVGSVFSAVSGFAVEMEYRDGEPWATDAHPTTDTPDYSLIPDDHNLRPGERLAVGVGILRDISPEVEEALEDLGLAELPVLHLRGEEPVVSAEHANVAVGLIKDRIRDALYSTGARHVDLFFAGPAPLALFLGHRLNATAPVRCYERTRPGRYVPTCTLHS